MVIIAQQYVLNSQSFIAGISTAVCCQLFMTKSLIFQAKVENKRLNGLGAFLLKDHNNKSAAMQEKAKKYPVK